MEAIVGISQVKSSALGAGTQGGSLADACHHCSGLIIPDTILGGTVATMTRGVQ